MEKKTKQNKQRQSTTPRISSGINSDDKSSPTLLFSTKTQTPGTSFTLVTPPENSSREVILQKQDICLSDVEHKRVAGLNDFSSLKECECCHGGVDFVTLISMLSALPLHRMPTSIAACFSVLKPGGLLLFRDYVIKWDSRSTCGFTEM
ncbi:unnamed protein product [Camellia sinensis]